MVLIRLWSLIGLGMLCPAMGSGCETGGPTAEKGGGEATHAVQTQGVRRPPLSAAEPAAVPDLSSALAQTAAIIDGRVSRVSTEYTEETGPWRRIEFDNVLVHRGNAEGGRLAFVQQGGDFPDGTVLELSTAHDFVVGSRYVLFLRNTNWNLSPVVGEYCFRVESDQGREMLIARDGTALLGLSVHGAAMSNTLFMPRDLNGDPPRRTAVPPPSRVLSVQGLLDAVDSSLVAIGQGNLNGEFYNEPRVRIGRIPQFGGAIEPTQAAEEQDEADDARPACESLPEDSEVVE